VGNRKSTIQMKLLWCKEASRHKMSHAFPMYMYEYTPIGRINTCRPRKRWRERHPWTQIKLGMLIPCCWCRWCRTFKGIWALVHQMLWCPDSYSGDKTLNFKSGPANSDILFSILFSPFTKMQSQNIMLGRDNFNVTSKSIINYKSSYNSLPYGFRYWHCR